MTRFRPRLWFGLGLSVLAAGPALAADPACTPAAQAPLGEAGESGEGEAGPATPAQRSLLLDQMAARIEGAAEARASGDAESADILAAAAADEGPARLARRGDPAEAERLERGLAPLAAAPEDAAAVAAGLRLLDAALGPATPERASGLAGLALEAFGAAQDCGRLTDRAAYVEARALARRARSLAAGFTGEPAREMTEALDRLIALLPASPPEPLPAFGAVSAQASRAILAASDIGAGSPEAGTAAGVNPATKP